MQVSICSQEVLYVVVSCFHAETILKANSIIVTIIIETATYGKVTTIVQFSQLWQKIFSTSIFRGSKPGCIVITKLLDCSSN